MTELDANAALDATTRLHGEAASGLRVFTGTLRRTCRGRATAFTSKPPSPPREPVRRPAKVARLLAMAHKLQRLIDEGKVKDRAELARQLGVSRARITQVLDLTLLAPDIQEEILFMEAVDGVKPVSERVLRRYIRDGSWAVQRRTWRVLRKSPYRPISSVSHHNIAHKDLADGTDSSSPPTALPSAGKGHQK